MDLLAALKTTGVFLGIVGFFALLMTVPEYVFFTIAIGVLCFIWYGMYRAFKRDHEAPR